MYHDVSLTRDLAVRYAALVSPLIERHLTPIGQELLDAVRVVVIEGARQVGKSTLSRLITADRPARHVTLDDDLALEMARVDPQAFLAREPGQTLVIDEIQRCLPLILRIKMAVDQDPGRGQFVLTGSSDLLALPALPDSLAGRAVTLRLGGLSQGELAGVWDDFAAWARHIPETLTSTTSTWDRPRYCAALAQGGYPECIGLRARTRAEWIASYVDRIVQHDVTELSTGLLPNRLVGVLRLLAAAQGSETVPSRLANDLAMPAAAINTYVRALRTMYLIVDLPPWTPNVTQREVGRHKLFVADSALAMHLDQIAPEALEQWSGTQVLGGLLESFAASELLKQRGWSSERFNVYHFRDRNGLEVDLVIEYGDGNVFLLEVKATTTHQWEHAASIRKLASKLGERFLGGAVLNLAQDARPLGANIWSLPLSYLWEHSGIGRTAV